MKDSQRINTLKPANVADFDTFKKRDVIAFKGENGQVIYVPKQKNIFAEAVLNNESLRTPLNECYGYTVKDKLV